MAFAFEKLQVYQKAITFAYAVRTIVRELPRGHFFLGDQFGSASFSSERAVVALMHQVGESKPIPEAAWRGLAPLFRPVHQR
jgi:hypothetical protein